MSSEMSHTTKELVEELRKIWDYDEFVDGVLAFADNEEDRKSVLNFIRAGDDVTSDTVNLCALDLNIKRYGEQ